jgi:hypothetical protein
MSAIWKQMSFDSQPHLSLSEIESMIQPPSPWFDQITANFLDAHRHHLHKIRVDHLDHHLEEFLGIWPEGTPVELFVAFSLCDWDIEALRVNLRDPAFIRAVLAYAAAYRFGDAKPHQSLVSLPCPDRSFGDRTHNSERPPLPLTRRQRAAASHEMMASAGANPDLLPLSSANLGGNWGELSLTFRKGDRRVAIGAALQQPVVATKEPWGFH